MWRDKGVDPAIAFDELHEVISLDTALWSRNL